MALPLGRMSKVVERALALRAKLLNDGALEIDADREVGQLLQQAWGVVDREPWRYLCNSCRDTGWVEIGPTDAAVHRLKKIYGADWYTQPHYEPCFVDCKWRVREQDRRNERSQK